MLAICRGSQVLNVALGGDLIQHLPEVVGHDGHKETPGTFADHEVEIEPGTRLAGLLGDRVAVKSHHHQGFNRLGAGLRPAARDEDGTVEALEDPSRRFALGVLWHPEAGEDTRLFEALGVGGAAYRVGDAARDLGSGPFMRIAIIEGWRSRRGSRVVGGDARGAAAQGAAQRRRAPSGDRPARRAGLLPDRAGDLRPAARLRPAGRDRERLPGARAAHLRGLRPADRPRLGHLALRAGPLRAATITTTSSATAAGRSRRSRIPQLETAIHRVEETSGYAVAGHDVVLHGACADCR